MLKIMLAASAATALALSAQAQAQESKTGPYIEGGYQYLHIEPDGASSGVESDGIGARAGYKFSPHFSVEGEIATGVDDGEFDYNVDEDEFNFDDNNDGDFEDVIAASGDMQLNYLVGIYGKAEMPVTDRLNAYARAGYAYVDIDAELQTPGGNTIATIADSADGPAIGAGLSYDVTDKVYVKGDYTYYDFDETDTEGVMVGVGYKF